MSLQTEKSSAASRWENEGGSIRPSTHDSETARKLAGHGITTIPLTVYEWSGYRYTNANDAIAAAERSAR